MRLEKSRESQEITDRRIPLGTLGHLVIFLWCLVLVLCSSPENMIWISGLCILVLMILYPGVWRSVFNGRRIILLGLIAIPPIFFLGDVDKLFLGIPYSSVGGISSLHIVLRFFVVLMALEGMTSAVEISALAGILERFGLKGLGFSIGVAVNLLPSLQKSCTQSWHTLKMRGGLRKRWWKGLKLFSLTSITCALKRAEEIALAAESRAFSPEKTRPLPVKRSPFDWVVFSLGFISILLII
jgi:energy-coupling factor transporter transmembrane protein EcfT